MIHGSDRRAVEGPRRCLFRHTAGRSSPQTSNGNGRRLKKGVLGDTEFVFPAASKSGHIAEPKFFLAQVAKATGRRISVHDLRRTFVTHAESCDISPHALRALVNHSLGKDVHSGYIQMNVERLREPAQRVTDKMKSMCGVKEPAGKNVAKLKRKG